MGISRNRPLTSSEPRGSGVSGWWASLFGPKPAAPAAPTAPPVQDLLDRLSLRYADTPSAVTDPATRQVIAGLALPGGAARLDAAGWQRLASQWVQLSPAGRTQLTSQLTAAGVRLTPSEDGRYVSFSAGDLRVTAEPSCGRLRRSQAGSVLCYEGATLVKAMKTSGNQVEVTTSQGTETWDASTGQGLRDGLPIVPRYAPLTPGEAPRQPWRSPLTNDLAEPAWTTGTQMSVYGPAYDQAVLATGGRVLEPTDPTEAAQDLYNCHSFATTGGQGDLFDPFMRETHPHWINNPLHQLLTGPFAQVQPSQRVRPGDVVVYYKDGKPTHTGIVRQVDREGNPSLVESKFGVLGRYLHEPFDVPGQYGDPASFFRPEGA